MASTPNTAAASGCPTTIAVLQAAYVRASIAYDANDEATCNCGKPAEYTHARAMNDLSAQQDFLRVAILREMPTNMQDALYIAWHASNAADLITNGAANQTAPEVAALEVTMQNFVAFLSRQDGVDLTQGDWFESQLQYPLRNSAARNGDVLKAAWN